MKWGKKYRVGLASLHAFEISRYNAAEGKRPAAVCLSAIFTKIGRKSGNLAQSFKSNAVMCVYDMFAPTMPSYLPAFGITS